MDFRTGFEELLHSYPVFLGRRHNARTRHRIALATLRDNVRSYRSPTAFFVSPSSHVTTRAAQRKCKVPTVPNELPSSPAGDQVPGSWFHCTSWHNWQWGGVIAVRRIMGRKGRRGGVRKFHVCIVLGRIVSLRLLSPRLRPHEYVR